jgi:hypothetical protein
MDANGVAGVVIACRAWNLDEYPPAQRRLWERVVRESLTDKGMVAPIVYPGSVPAVCESCGVTVAVGPRQQATRKKHGAIVTILCLLCIAGLENDMPDADFHITALDNPDDPNVTS